MPNWLLPSEAKVPTKRGQPQPHPAPSFIVRRVVNQQCVVQETNPVEGWVVGKRPDIECKTLVDVFPGQVAGMNQHSADTVPLVAIGANAGRPACFTDGPTDDRGAPKGIRIPVAALKGQSPWPLDDGGVFGSSCSAPRRGLARWWAVQVSNLRPWD